MYEVLAFYIFSGLSLACVGVSVFSKNVLNALTALAGGMIFISALFFLLGAEFIGVVQIIVYAGAVMVLYAFSMMFFNVSKNVEQRRGYSVYLIVVFIAILITAIFMAPVLAQEGVQNISSELNNIQLMGVLIFSKYLLAFELVAILLLVAMIASIVLISKSKKESV